MLLRSSNSYSATVRMSLLVGGHSVRMGQMGPGFLVLAEPHASQARHGVVLLTVDGITEEIPVLLPQGIPAGADRVETAEASDGALIAA